VLVNSYTLQLQFSGYLRVPGKCYAGGTPKQLLRQVTEKRGEVEGRTADGLGNLELRCLWSAHGPKGLRSIHNRETLLGPCRRHTYGNAERLADCSV
jgi:hypothetical protein